MCKQDPRCVTRRLHDSSGAIIRDPSQFLDRAAEVLSVYTGRSIGPADVYNHLSFVPLAMTITEDWENAEHVARGGDPSDPWSPPNDGIVFERFGLCGNHARQLARGALVALHYKRCFPNEPPPPPKLIWGAGSLAENLALWFVPVVVALFRAHALALKDDVETNKLFDGLREHGRRVVRPIDDQSADQFAMPIMAFGSMLDGELRSEGGQSHRLELDAVVRGYRNDDLDLLSRVAEYFWCWRQIDRLSRAAARGTTTTVPNTPGTWWKTGFGASSGLRNPKHTTTGHSASDDSEPDH
jgi:hypothetical protein